MLPESQQCLNYARWWQLLSETMSIQPVSINVQWEATAMQSRSRVFPTVASKNAKLLVFNWCLHSWQADTVNIDQMTSYIFNIFQFASQNYTAPCPGMANYQTQSVQRLQLSDQQLVKRHCAVNMCSNKNVFNFHLTLVDMLNFLNFRERVF